MYENVSVLDLLGFVCSHRATKMMLCDDHKKRNNIKKKKYFVRKFIARLIKQIKMTSCSLTVNPSYYMIDMVC